MKITHLNLILRRSLNYLKIISLRTLVYLSKLLVTKINVLLINFLKFYTLD